MSESESGRDAMDVHFPIRILMARVIRPLSHDAKSLQRPTFGNPQPPAHSFRSLQNPIP